MNPELAHWLEDGLKTIIEGGFKCIAIQAIRPDDEIVTGYYRCGVQDKVLMAHTIQTDALKDTLYANLDHLKSALDDIEQEDHNEP